MSDSGNTLKKSLGMWDVFAIGLAAMFSSGFFLIPAIAAEDAGLGLVLAYLFAGLSVLPAMLSIAELSTAMPKAGGTYYFLDRSLGPIFGTIGGIGSWLAVAFKSVFALIGMGAYLAYFLDMSVTNIALILTIVFAALNILGAKEASGILKAMIWLVLAFCIGYVIYGMATVENNQFQYADSIKDWMPKGGEAFLYSMGLVFVSYAGLTKAASIAEEVKNPDKNMPWGMLLALVVAIVLYIAGVYVMIAVLGTGGLVASTDLVPVLDAGKKFIDFLPYRAAEISIAVIAVVAFAATANAGVLSASRYPLAMARDRLIPKYLGKLNKSGSPHISIIATTILMLLSIQFMPVKVIAKLASVFQLFLFIFINLAVIVMRESRISAYDPGYRAPLYPWMQIAGMLISVILITVMGTIPLLLTMAMIAICVGWYFYYAFGKVDRPGAVFHLYERLGRSRNPNLNYELRDIIREKGLRNEDPFEEIVARAIVVDEKDTVRTFEEVVDDAATILSDKVSVEKEQLIESFMSEWSYGATPTTASAVLPNVRVADLHHCELVIVRSKAGILMEGEHSKFIIGSEHEGMKVHALFFLISPESDSGRHLRLLAQLCNIVEKDNFKKEWLAAKDHFEMRNVLLRNERYLTLIIKKDGKTQPLEGKQIKDLRLPQGVLIALIQREGKSVVPTGSTELKDGDHLIIIGSPQAIKKLSEQYVTV